MSTKNYCKLRTQVQQKPLKSRPRTLQLYNPRPPHKSKSR